MPAGRPTGHVNIPAQVERIAVGQALQPVWENELGGVTFAVAGANPRFVKWAPAETTLNLTAEAARLRWAVPFTSVPEVLGEGADERGAWLVTAALPGEHAVSETWQRDPGAAVRGIGRGLRALHEAVGRQYSVQFKLFARRHGEAHSQRIAS